jgi:uncharacterized damage-inducible protein DinB
MLSLNSRRKNGCISKRLHAIWAGFAHLSACHLNAKEHALEIFYLAYLDCLEKLHAGFEQALAGLPPEALDWSPGPEMNTIAQLVVHTAGAERYWIGSVAGQDPAARERSAEFRAGGFVAADLLRHLSAALDHSRGVLERLSLADLNELRVSPRDGQQFAAGWALAHALEHTALHLGHLQLTRQLWLQHPPP